MLAVERYRQRQASLGKAVELAGVSVGQMMEIRRSTAWRATSSTRIISRGFRVSGRRGETANVSSL